MLYVLKDFSGRVALSVALLTEESEVPGSISGPAHNLLEIENEFLYAVLFLFHRFKKGSCQLLTKV